MAKQLDQKLLQEYIERNTRWTDRTLSQMSFYNNLILTLGIGFLSFAFESTTNKNNIDCSLVLYLMSMVLLTLSIYTGLFASLSRLYDFRITRQVNLIRQRVLEDSNKKLDEKTPEELSFWKNIFLVYELVFQDYPIITLEQCKDWKKDEKNLNGKFMKLRSLSYNLGFGTWLRIKLQTIFLLLSIILYVSSILLTYFY